MGKIIPLPTSVAFSDDAVDVHGGLQAAITAATEAFRRLLYQAVARQITGPGDLFAFEQDLHAAVPRECLDPVTAAVIEVAHDDDAVLDKAQGVLDTLQHVRLQKHGQLVKISLRGGSQAQIRTPYFLERDPGRRGPKRRQGQRGRAAGRGWYPVLAALGIHGRMTPAYGSEVARLVTTFSEDEAREELSRQGVKLSKSAIRRVVRIIGDRALAHRRRQLEQTSGPLKDSPVEGKRIGIFLDGGRIRVRLKKRGRKRKNGGKSFSSDWKEPKAFVIFEFDKQGRKVRRGFVRYDATMGDADAVFKLLAGALRDINAQEAKAWVIGGDGAQWIWNRAGKLAKELGFSIKKVFEVVDLWHAVGYIWEFANLKKRWSQKSRQSWVRLQKRRLKAGEIESIVAAMRELCTGPMGHDLKVIADRFQKNRDRMRYAEFRRKNLPCGSGAMESAIRRIINLRLKGPGIFWHLEAAERLLHLRSQRLCGQWDEYMLQILEPMPLWYPKPASKKLSKAA